jgi:short-subunit dehydrogenase
MKNEMILITGSNSGLGLHFAKLALQEKKKVILHGRNAQKLEKVVSDFRSKGFEVESVCLDLGVSGSAQILFDHCETNGWNITELINKAGYGAFGRFDEIDLPTQTAMMQLNMISLVELCHLFGKKMLAHGGGKILNIASIAAFQPGPKMNVYCASKSFVLSFSEALHFEWKDAGVSVSCLCPGPTDTGFVSAANLQDSQLASGKFMKWVPAAPVALKGYQAMQRGTMTVVDGLMNNFLTLLIRILPKKWVVGISAKMMDRIH